MPTGEALLPELARLWLHRHPSIPLVNAYGPAECADDVSLCRIDTPPPHDALAVPIGSPTDNNRIYLLDHDLQRVALGVVGELCVAGVGVGRGYLGDPAKTAEAFVPSPFGSGERLYRTGDLARLRWDGSLEYVGRKDQQVKVRGYRIELGEIEARLAEQPLVGSAVVLARGETGRGRRLVAYIAPKRVGTPVDEREIVATLKAALGQQLPEYMVPASWVLMSELPRSKNGKLDRRALPEPGALDEQRAFVAPETDVERELAQIWEQLLRVDRVSLEDDFFELGGDSIVALQLVSRAKRAGLALSPRAVFEHPMLGALARVTTRGAPDDVGCPSAPAPDPIAAALGGEVPLLPIQHWFFEQTFANKHHWNQSVLLVVPAALDLELLERALVAVIAHHAALRLRFQQTEHGWRQFYGPAEPARLDQVDLGAEQDVVAALTREANRVQRSLDLEHGPLSRFVLFRWADERRLLVVMHHLISDTVSWRILFEDWREAYGALTRGEAIELAPVPTSYQRWSLLLREHAQSAALQNELPYWRSVLGAERSSLPARDPSGDNRVRATRTISVTLREAETSALLNRAPRFFGTMVNDLLLCALALTMCRWSNQKSLLVELEGHGREALFDGVDLSRTVGWFTSPQMIRLEPVLGDLPASIRAIRAQLRRAPHHGLGYGVTRYLTDAGAEMEACPFPQVFFNYLGQFDQLFVDDEWLSPASEPRGDERCPDSTEDAWFGGGGVVHGGRMRLDFRYSEAIHDATTARLLAEQFAEQLREIVRLCTQNEALSVADLPPGAE